MTEAKGTRRWMRLAYGLWGRARSRTASSAFELIETLALLRESRLAAEVIRIVLPPFRSRRKIARAADPTRAV